VIRCDALVVGGGPGGSTCARLLQKGGWSVLLADRATFPRDKVCAGWLTPQVFALLDLDPAEYRATGLTFQEITAFRTGVIGSDLIETRYPRVVSYGIRRCEFDDFLLRRARVRTLEGTPIASLRHNGNTWIVNDAIEARVVIGAGGHFCPVARHMRRGQAVSAPVVAKEAEFRLPPNGVRVAGDTPELFFCRDLEGYGWCVRKGDYLNIGIGRRDSRDFGTHVKGFIAFLEANQGLPRGAEPKWRGHAYLATGIGNRRTIDNGMLLVGDAAGLAYPESGEGIRPAIESGRRAAETLLAAEGRCDVEALSPYADTLQRLYPARPRTPAPARGAAAAVGRLLLGSASLTRRVVLDRWFLRT
jgi:geranylgeranyl reductase family protein